jgi:hypothetical protein
MQLKIHFVDVDLDIYDRYVGVLKEEENAVS